MNKKVKYTFGGVNQDISKGKHPFQFYYEAQHIKLLATDSQSTGSVTNEKGTELVISIPDININSVTSTITYGTSTLIYKYGNEIDQQINNSLLPISSNSQQIIGHTTTRDGIILFSTDDLGMDCIWLLSEVLGGVYELKLLYLRNLNLSTSSPIQAIFNYENDNIQKVYWVDGNNQIRTINIRHEEVEDNGLLIDIPSTSINFVGEINFSQPTITATTGGGTHTAGMVQYAYNLYRLNSSQTKLSPLSELVALGKGKNLGGGELNEVVALTPVVEINNIDLTYTHIKVYAIKYTSYNEIPSVNLIEERELDSNSLTVYDDGTTIASLSLEEFLFLGSNPVIPKHIETKDNRLFLANIQTKEFVLPDELDCRAYSFGSNSTSTHLYNNIRSTLDPLVPQLEEYIVTGDATLVSSPTFNLPSKHDSINLDYDVKKYQPGTTIFGGEGKYIKFEIVQKDLNNVENYRLLKDREIYRFGIQFYNNLGQVSLPEWIADYKMPSGNLEGNYNTLKVELKSEFYTWLNSYNFETKEDIPIGYKIIRANRTVSDKTIICQGILTGMMVNSPRSALKASLYTTVEKREDSKIQKKLPNFLTRTFQEIPPVQPNSHLKAMQFTGTKTQSGNAKFNPLNEVQLDGYVRKADTYQYTTMYQMHSPEILFDNININTSTKFSIIGGAKTTNNAFWGQHRHIVSKVVRREGKCTGKINGWDVGGINLDINGRVKDLIKLGLIGDTNEDTADVSIPFTQYYREFNNFIPGNNYTYSIYGSPELTQRGQGNTTYNNKSQYEYSNTLEGFLTDGERDWDSDGSLTRAIISINSYSNKCVTFVADNGDNSDLIEPHNRISMEKLYSSSNINDTDTVLMSELVRPNNDIYLGGIYRGNSYEDKKGTEYITIGEYKDINTTSTQIDSPGDTYVQNFRFTRIGKTDKEVYAVGVAQLTEIIEFKVETTIDLKNRNDVSISQWDTRFQPRDDEYHQYNDVYTQQPTLVKTTDVDFTFKRIKNFDTRLQSTKLKIPNESIDNWTDILENEIMDLNGKYGPINNITSFNDNIFAFQDEAIANISINPRVQVQGSDGIGLELGTGGILYDFNYITTKSGSINKWGVVPTKKGIYYYDALNKGIGRVPDATKFLLTDIKGLHAFHNSNYTYDSIKKDNPIEREGVVFGYDNYNNDVYFTLLQNEKSFTWCFNEVLDTFIDLKSYKPSMYIYKGEKFLSISGSNDKLYEHNKGIYNNFYGTYQPSYITLQLNPESDFDCIFDNIFYNSELYLSDVDQPDKTLTHIQAYSEYQDSGRIPLIVGRGSNLRRKFREWKAEIPREGRNRIRNPWIFLKLELDNTSNYKLILHDITVGYTV